MNLSDFIRNIPDFPKEGILFKDITPLLAHPPAFQQAVEEMAAIVRESGAEKIMGIESRGFIFGAAVAYHLGLGFIPVRKPGKLPYTTIRESYSLEYGTDALEIHEDALKEGERVAVIDDLLATGGTAGAAARLAETLKAEVTVVLFLIELTFLDGRKALEGQKVHSLISV